MRQKRSEKKKRTYMFESETFIKLPNKRTIKEAKDKECTTQRKKQTEMNWKTLYKEEIEQLIHRYHSETSSKNKKSQKSHIAE